jgi:hypothetical protein
VVDDLNAVPLARSRARSALDGHHVTLTGSGPPTGGAPLPRCRSASERRTRRCGGPGSGPR